MTAHPSRPDLIAAARHVIAMEAEFRAQLDPRAEWSGDPLSDAIADLSAALASEPEPQPVADLKAVARAICRADGFDPDEEIIGGQAQAFENYGPRWQAFSRSDGMATDRDYEAMARAASPHLAEEKKP